MKHCRKAYIPFLALILLAAVSCGSESQKAADSASGETTDTATETVTEAETEVLYTANVPEADFGGKEFRVMGISPEGNSGMLLEFDPDAESGDIVLDSVYKRNRKIEEQFNMVFVDEYKDSWSDMSPLFEKLVLSGDSTYQMVMLICREAFPAAISGKVMPYSEIPYLDSTQPWYMKNVNEAMSVGGTQYLLYTDESMNTYMQTVCTFFNKQMVSSYDLEDPYQLVRDGKWTLDVFYEMAASVISDVDGNGTYDLNDVYGVTSETDMFYPTSWIGAGICVIEKDSDDMPVYTASGNEKLINVLTTFHEHLQQSGFYIDSFQDFGEKATEATRDKSVEFFTQNHALFMVRNIGKIELMRDMEADFGILPLPKYDESQESYYSRMIDGWIHVVPNTEQDTEFVGTIMESLAAETRNYVIPAYFETALTDKYSRDTDSEEMLDIVFNNVAIDLGDTVWYDSVRSPLQSAMDGKSFDPASWFAKREKSITKALEKSLSAITED